MVPRRIVLWGLFLAAVCFGAVSSSRASLTGGVSSLAAGVGGGAHNILCDGLPPYVVFVDAGSTGCRAHTFQVVPGELPAFALRTMGKKVKGITPLASLAGKTDEQITEALVPMLTKALEKVPEQHRHDTPLYVWATAGMRVLKDHQQDQLWAVRRRRRTAEPNARVETFFFFVGDIFFSNVARNNVPNNDRYTWSHGSERIST